MLVTQKYELVLGQQDILTSLHKQIRLKKKYCNHGENINILTKPIMAKTEHVNSIF